MKKNVKSIISLFFVFAIICAMFAGCSKTEAEDETTSSTSTTAVTTTAPTTESTTQPVTEPTTVSTTKKAETTKKAVTTTQKVTTTAAPAKSVPSYSTTAFEKEIFNLINNERSNAGKSGLKWSDQLHNLACIRAKEASKNWSHTRPNGGSWDTVFKEYNIKHGNIGENLAQGPQDAEAIMGGLMKSQSHKDNILKGTYTKAGIGSYTSGDITYIVQLFEE